MTRFINGPAAAQTLALGRAPLFLRVTLCRGVFDALDKLEDVPRPGEQLFAYEVTQEPGMAHVSRRGKGAQSGWFTIAEYRLVKVQPSDDVMRDAIAWRQWCLAQGHPFRHGKLKMEDGKEGGAQ